MEFERVKLEDLEKINRLRNKYIEYIRQWKPQTIEDQIKWFNTTNDIYFTAKSNGGTFYGVAGLTNIDLINRKAELSLITEEYLKTNIADYLLDNLEKYAFTKLNLHKIFITAYNFDYKKIKYFRDRYIYSHTYKDNVINNNVFHDEHYFYITKDAK